LYPAEASKPSPMRTIRNLPGPLSSAKGRLASLILEEARELRVDAGDVLRRTGEERAAAGLGDLLQDLGLGVGSVRDGEDAGSARVLGTAFLPLALRTESAEKLLEVNAAGRIRSVGQDDEGSHRPFRVAPGRARRFGDRVVEAGVPGGECAVHGLLEPSPRRSDRLEVLRNPAQIRGEQQDADAVPGGKILHEDSRSRFGLREGLS